jgi:hypothetical protein
MKYPVFLATAASVMLVSTACSAGQKSSLSTHPAPAASAAPSPVHNASTTKHVAANGAGADSPFCALARRIGTADLGVSSGNQDPDPTKLLGQVDQLDTLAPAELKRDVDVFTAFEHSVLDPGRAGAPKIKGDPTPALEHVSSCSPAPAV